MATVLASTPVAQDVPQNLGSVCVVLHLCAPWSRALSFSVPRALTVAALRRDIDAALGAPVLGSALVRLATRGGCALYDDDCLGRVCGSQPWLDLEMRVRHLGGKGGFGNNLRAQGGRMSKGSRNENQDACRDLQGRRLGSIKEAQLLAAYMAQAPEREKAFNEAQKRKYAKLEKMLGRAPASAADFEEAAQKLDDAGDALEGDENADSPAIAGPSSHTGQAKRKERLDDHEYVEQSREIVGSVRSAVASAMKKRKGKQREGARSASAAPDARAEASAAAT